MNKVEKLPNGIDLSKLPRLLRFSDKYEISIQFWPEQIAVYIEKDGVELTSYGGSFAFAIKNAISYLERINPKRDETEYLLSTKENRRVLLKSVKDLEASDTAMSSDKGDAPVDSSNSIEQLVVFIKELKSDAMERYRELDDEEGRAVYSCQNMICGMILSKIESLNTNHLC